MSPLFIAEFKKQNKCSACKSKASRWHKMCLYHLRMARDRFAAWSAARREQKLCLACNRKGFKRPDGSHELRCPTHKKVNQQRCKSWCDRMKAVIMATGRCGCRARNPVIPGTLRCSACAKAESDRQRAYRASKKALMINGYGAA